MIQKLMAKIEYQTYKFNKPPLLNDGDYDTLKEILTEWLNWI